MENENLNVSETTETENIAKNDSPIEMNIPEIQMNILNRETETQKNENTEPVLTKAQYTWSYSEQLKQNQKNKKKESRKGTLVYFTIVISLFAVVFAILAAVLAFGYINGFSTRSETVYLDRVVYVREDDGSSGILTVQEIVAKVTPSTVAVLVTTSEGSGTGTGIVLDKEGHISTDYHVIADATDIRIYTQDGREFPCEYVGGDELSDIAVLKVDPNSFELIPAEFGDSDQVLVGDSVVAIGNASGVELFGSATTGIVSGIRNLKFYDSNGLVSKTMKFIQTNAQLNPGVSGGPVCDEYGRVIGIVVMKLLYENEIEGVGFAIPASLAKQAFDEIIETGSYSGGIATKGVSLGIKITEVFKDAVVQIDSENTLKACADGVMVVEITDKNSSAYGYLEIGDVIVSVEGKTVISATDVRSVLAELIPGDTITLTVCRNGTEMNIVIPLK